MKYKTFRSLALLGAAVVVAGAVAAVVFLAPAASTETATAVSTPAATAPPVATATAPAVVEGGSASDRAVLELVTRMKPTAKVKDASKGTPFKINLYSDDGVRWNRAKVDLDRDDKWDESWTWKTDDLRTPEKKVAPSDDESYTETYALTGGGAWQRK